MSVLTQPNPLPIILVVAGSLVVFGLLRYLHKHLRLFTRGTVTFMAFALVTFTVISVLAMLHDVKLEEERAHSFARRRAVHGAVLGWLKDQGDADSLEFRRAFAEDLSAIEKAVAADVDSECEGGCSFDDLQLVALDVDWRPSPSYVQTALHWQRRHCWEYEAVFHDESDGELHRVTGKVFTTDPKGEGFVITGVSGSLAKPGRTHYQRCKSLIDCARVYREAEFNTHQLDSKVLTETRENRSGYRRFKTW